MHSTATAVAVAATKLNYPNREHESYCSGMMCMRKIRSENLGFSRFDEMEWKFICSFIRHHFACRVHYIIHLVIFIAWMSFGHTRCFSACVCRVACASASFCAEFFFLLLFPVHAFYIYSFLFSFAVCWHSFVHVCEFPFYLKFAKHLSRWKRGLIKPREKQTNKRKKSRIKPVLHTEFFLLCLQFACNI